jgi:hypothetical protein
MRLWIEERKSRKISIKHGDIEVSFSGGVTNKNIDTSISRFIDLEDRLRREGDKIRAELAPDKAKRTTSALQNLAKAAKPATPRTVEASTEGTTSRKRSPKS